MKRKLILPLVLCVVMILGACAQTAPDSRTSQPQAVSSSQAPAADTTTDSAQPASKDPITFTMFIGAPGQPNAKDSKVIKKLEELTGVTLEMEFLIGDLDQKMGVMIASGDYPDLINPSQGRSRFLQAGAFVALEDLIPQYPNINKHFEPYMDKLRNVSPDKHIYLMDNWGRYYFYDEDYRQYLPEHNGPAFWVQKDVLADAGYIIPKTLDEFFDMLEAYYIKNPTIDGQATLPFEVLSYDWRLFCLLNAPQHLIGAPNDGDCYVDKTTYKSEIYANKDYAKKYFQKLNDVYHKGMISPETFTQNYDQYLSKVSTGRVLAMFDQQWNFQDGELVLITENNIKRTYVPIGLTYPGYEQWYRELPNFAGGNGMGISIKCKDVPRAMEYINTLLDEDVQKMLYWGFEGEDYYIDNGRMRRTAEQKAHFDNNDWKYANLGNSLGDQFPKLQGQYSDGNACDAQVQPEEKRDNMLPYDKEFYAKYDFSSKSDCLTTPGPVPDYYPAWAFTLEDGSDARVAIENIKELGRKYLPRVIMADDFESAWAEYVALIEKENYKAYEAEIDRQIAERMNL